MKNLEAIKPEDAEREQAFAHVKGWLTEHGQAADALERPSAWEREQALGRIGDIVYEAKSCLPIDEHRAFARAIINLLNINLTGKGGGWR